jgi:hypothetical protein
MKFRRLTRIFWGTLRTPEEVAARQQALTLKKLTKLDPERKLPGWRR